MLFLEEKHVLFNSMSLGHCKYKLLVRSILHILLGFKMSHIETSFVTACPHSADDVSLNYLHKNRLQLQWEALVRHGFQLDFFFFLISVAH